jgi:putative ABC transport system ATP-binding protein
MSCPVEATTLPSIGVNDPKNGISQGAPDPVAPPPDLTDESVSDWLRKISRSRSVSATAPSSKDVASFIEPLHPVAPVEDRAHIESGELAEDVLFSSVAFDSPDSFEPISLESIAREPTFEPLSEPIMDEPLIDESVVDESVLDEPVTYAPVTYAPVMDEPVTYAPVMDEPVKYAPVMDEPVTYAPVMDEPVTYAPVMDEPVTYAPVMDEPVMDDLLAGESESAPASFDWSLESPRSLEAETAEAPVESPFDLGDFAPLSLEEDTPWLERPALDVFATPTAAVFPTLTDEIRRELGQLDSQSTPEIAPFGQSQPTKFEPVFGSSVVDDPFDLGPVFDSENPVGLGEPFAIANVDLMGTEFQSVHAAPADLPSLASLGIHGLSNPDTGESGFTLPELRSEGFEPVPLQVFAAPPGASVLFGDLTPTTLPTTLPTTPASVTSAFRQHLNQAANEHAANEHAASTAAPAAPSVVTSAFELPDLPPLAVAPVSAPVPNTEIHNAPAPSETSGPTEPEFSPTVAKLPGTGQIIVAARKLTKFRTIGEKRVEVLNDVTLDLPAGHFIVINGASGSGKTTLLSCLAGIDSFDRGELLFEGHALTDLTESDRARHRASAMGFVFQGFHLVSVLTAVENVELPLLVAGWSAGDARDEALAALSLVGLSSRVEQLPDQLSGGEQQRVAIARALVGEPRIVFADEPTGNLDDSSAKKIAHLFHELHADGLTIVVATHDARLLGLATLIVDVKDGRVTERSGPRSIV